jgi:hypothetical protein
MYATDYFETKILNIFRGTTAQAASNLYVALYLSDPTDTGGAGTEVSYPGYARQAITFTVPYAESGGIGVKNTAVLTWPISNVDAGTVTHIGILDSAVLQSGNMWLYGDLTDTMPISAGNQPIIQTGDVLYYSTGNFSIWFKTAVLNLLRGTSVSGITPYLALYSGDPENSGAELSGGSYARPAITFGAPYMGGGGAMTMENSQEVSFNAPTSTWGLWAWDGIANQATNGNLIVKYQNTTPEQILKNYIPYFEAGGYTVSIN